ncbi:vesicle transport protein SFT2A [Lepeophtheirus salmonis]|uniref:Vesicle transport protein n=1 Tax=Lepeophtheirus salmonis TaxID=72036 RepID=A0A0K2V9F2_LEPSM|nr:vesicle transport protein SFT2A-like [Lepeophtheirus salmonis]
MDKLKQFLGPSRGNFVNEEDNIEAGNGDEAERGFVAQALDSSTLSWKTRLKGFVVCFAIGCFISILSTITLALNGGLIKFAVLYSIGNIISLLSTCFLMGPLKQIKNMFAPTRAFATVIMLVTLLLTLLSALAFHKKGLTILFCIIQYLAMIWYSISYIPFARDAVLKCFNGLLG